MSTVAVLIASSPNLDALRLHGLTIVADATRTAPTIGGLPTVGGHARWWQLEGPDVTGGTVERI